MPNKTFPSLLPSNSTTLERALEQACSHRCDTLNLNLSALYNADECPIELLPWLAWASHVPSWDHNWPESQKREAITLAASCNRKKGTAWAVRSALRSTQIESSLIEWWQQSPKAAPYTFTTRIWLNEQPTGAFGNPSTYTRLFDIVDEYKNVRSHYDVKIGAKFTQGVAVTLASSNHATESKQANVAPVPIRNSKAKLGITLASSNHATEHKQADIAPVPIRNSCIASSLHVSACNHATGTKQAVVKPVTIRHAKQRLNMAAFLQFRATLNMGYA